MDIICGCIDISSYFYHGYIKKIMWVLKKYTTWFLKYPQSLISENQNPFL